MKTSLVTGGAGFLGSHLCERLLEAEHRVICVDNLVTGNRRNIAHLEDGVIPFEFIEHDITLPLETLPLNIERGIDYVLHMASPASPMDYLKLPIETLDVGSVGTRNALELARKNGARFLLASTSEVYGDPEQHPQQESYWGNVNSIGPRSCYDEAKRFAEAMVMAFNRQYNLETRIVRIFNTYGPRMQPLDGRVVPAFIDQILDNKPLTIFGDGSQTRSFCFVDDLVEGIYRLLLSDRELPTNIGNPDEMTIREFAERVIKLTGSSSPVTYQDLPEDDPKKRRPDITIARSVLDWQPRVPLDKGLSKTIDYFRSLKEEKA